MNDDKKITEELASLKTLLSGAEQRIQALEKRFESVQEKTVAKPIPQVIPSAAQAKPVAKKYDWHSLELTIGKYFLQIIGIALFIFGALFFIKYAMDRGWISPLVRVLMCFVAGTGLLGLGEYLRIRQKMWSQAIVAGGFLLYYIGVYAAFPLYNLIEAPIAFAAFALISLSSMFYAVRYDSAVMAYFGLIGGFIATLDYVLQSKVGDATFVFLFILAATALMLALLKHWYFLAFLAFSMTEFVIIDLSRTAYKEATLQLILLLLFNLAPIGYVLYRRSSELFESVVVLFSSLIIFLRLRVPFLKHFYRYPEFKSTSFFKQGFSPDVLQGICCGLGTFFLLETFALCLSKRKVGPLLLFLITGAFIFYSGALVFAFTDVHGFLLNTAATILFTFGYLYKERGVMLAAAGLWGFVFILPRYFFGSHEAVMTTTIIPYPAHLSAFLLTVFFLALALLFSRLKDRIVDHQDLPSILLAGAAAVPLYWMHGASFYAHASQGLIPAPYDALLFAFYGASLLFMGFAYGQVRVAYVGCASVALSVGYSIFHYVEYMRNQTPLPLIILLGGLSLIFVTLFLLLHLLRSTANLFYERVKQGAAALAFAALFFYGRTGIIFGVHYYHMLMQAKTTVASLFEYVVRGRAAEGIQPLRASQYYRDYALILYYGVTGLLLILGGFAYKKTYVRYVGLFLFFIMLVKMLILVGSFRNTLTRIGAFLLIGCILVVASYIYQRIAKRES